MIWGRGKRRVSAYSRVKGKKEGSIVVSTKLPDLCKSDRVT